MANYKEMIEENNEVAKELLSLSKKLLRTKEAKEKVSNEVELVICDSANASLEMFALQEKIVSDVKINR